MNRKLRGVKMIRKLESPTYSISVFEFNQERYSVLLERYLFGVRVFRKQYDFADEGMANRFFESMIARLGIAFS
jgi:hypothetical protein